LCCVFRPELVEHMQSRLISYAASCALSTRRPVANVRDVRHDCFPFAEWIQAVQALMILSVIFCCCAFFAFVCQLFTLKKGGRFFITGVLQLLACACVLTAASIYVGWFQPQHLPSSGPGYSYILAWVAFTLTFLSGIIYCFLRKKE
uniref:Epithelial membrane protein 2 n=1 Tax=Petromyzon marinus TaxID=7757 RepID=S4RZM8_PETMA